MTAPVGVWHCSKGGRVKGELHKGFEVAVCFAGEFDAEVGSVDKVTDSILCSINVTWGAFVVVLCYDVGNGGQVGSGLSGKPVEGSDIFLE